MTIQEKLLLLYTMIESSQEVFALAGVSSFGEIETYANTLDAAAQSDIDSVTEEDIYRLYVMLEACAFFPSMRNISRYWRDLEGAIVIVPVGPESIFLRSNGGSLEYSFDGEQWKATMPPDAHSHAVVDISDFPSTMPPSVHTHSFDALANIPAEFPPAEHNHQILELLGVEQAFTINCRPISDGTDTQIMTFSGRSDLKTYAPSPPKLGICIRENDMNVSRRCLLVVWIEGDYQPAIYVNVNGFGFSPPSKKLEWVSDEIGIYAFKSLDPWLRNELCTHFWTFFC